MRPGALCAAALLAAGTACTGALPELAPGQRPALESDEAGFWMQMDRIEQQLRTSGHLVQDPELDAYVRDVVCSLAGEHCPAIRVYVVQTPHFNASMRPNGAMEVWSGLLLRATNEAQLAFVLGHEIAHFERRHTLARWRRLERATDALAVFSVIAAGAGAGYAGNLASLATATSLLAFDRSQEREADRIGFERMVREGYDPREAAALWQQLLEERAAADDDEPLPFLSTHPSSRERVETLEEMARQALAAGGGGELRRDRYLPVAARVRRVTLRQDLALREPERSEVLLDHLARSRAAPPGEVEFFRGELYRGRGGDGDAERAIACYRAAEAAGGAPPELHRGLGLLLQRRGEREPAREQFERYLAALPEANDRLMIESYVESLSR